MFIPKVRPNRLGAVLLVGGMLLLTSCTAFENKKSETISQIDETVTTTLNPANASAAQKVMKFYQSVTLDETRTNVETMLGGAGEVQADGQVAYLDPESGYGVLIRYSEDDKVFAKRLIPATKSPELAALNPEPVTDKQAYRMAAGMPFYEVQDVMGSDGIEVSLSKPEPGSPKQVYGLGWFNPDGSYAVVFLSLPKGEVIASEFISPEK